MHAVQGAHAVPIDYGKTVVSGMEIGAAGERLLNPCASTGNRSRDGSRCLIFGYIVRCQDRGKDLGDAILPERSDVPSRQHPSLLEDAARMLD